jgi:membrane protein implicated in regulation of membrane protease activity
MTNDVLLVVGGVCLVIGAALLAPAFGFLMAGVVLIGVAVLRVIADHPSEKKGTT